MFGLFARHVGEAKPALMHQNEWVGPFVLLELVTPRLGDRLSPVRSASHVAFRPS